MNHVARRQQPAGCNDGFARRQSLRVQGATYLAAFLNNAGAARAVNRAVNASAAHQGRVGCVDQSLNRLPREVPYEHAHAPIQECFQSLFSQMKSKPAVSAAEKRWRMTLFSNST
jgi:hypothetical protein